MTGKETRQYEMLVRVGKFGETHRGLFPETTEGGRAFATVAGVVGQLTTYDDSKRKTSEEGKEAKAMARQALLDRLRSIGRTASVIARKTPGFADRFKLPKPAKPTDQAVLGAGRIFADVAEAEKDRFTAHGMPETFVADLRQLVETFGAAIHTRETGRERRAVAHKGLAAALRQGLDAVRALDVIVANQLGGNGDALAAWEHDRKVEFSRRSKRPTPEPTSALSATSPTSATSIPGVANPAPAAASVPVMPEPQPAEAGVPVRAA